MAAFAELVAAPERLSAGLLRYAVQFRCLVFWGLTQCR